MSATFSKGDRILLAHCSGTNVLSSKSLLWEVSIENRSGCIVEMNALFGTDEYTCIAMDQYLNNEPYKREIEFSSLRNIPGEGKKLFMIPSNLVGTEVILQHERFDPFHVQCKSFVLCGFKECTSRLISRNQAFFTCRHPGHFLCCHHCVAMEPTSTETLNKYREFKRTAEEYLASKHLPASHMFARTSFAFPLWQKQRSPAAAAKILEDFFGQNYVPCPACEADHVVGSVRSTPHTPLTFEELEVQLRLVDSEISFGREQHTNASSVASAPSHIAAAAPSHAPSHAPNHVPSHIVPNHLGSSHVASNNPFDISPVPHKSEPPAAVPVTDKPAIRTPTADSPLSNEEVIEVLIVLRKGLLTKGCSYEETMAAMKKVMAARLLKTRSVDEVSAVVLEVVEQDRAFLAPLSSVSASPPGSSMPSLGGGPSLASGSTSAGSLPAPLQRPVIPTLQLGLPPAFSPPITPLNPFDEEINKSGCKPPLSARPAIPTLSLGLLSSNLSSNSDESTNNNNWQSSSPRLSARGSPANSARLSRTNTDPDLKAPPSSSLLRTATEGDLVARTGPALPNDVGDHGSIPLSLPPQPSFKGLSRTASKRGDVLTNLPSSSDPAALGRLSRPSSISSNITSTSDDSVFDQPQNALMSHRGSKSSRDRPEREEALTPTGSGSGSLSHTSSMSGSSFDGLLKKTSDSDDHAPHQVKMLLPHTVPNPAGESYIRGAASDSRSARRPTFGREDSIGSNSPGTVEPPTSSLMRTMSRDSQELLVGGMQSARQKPYSRSSSIDCDEHVNPVTPPTSAGEGSSLLRRTSFRDVAPIDSSASHSGSGPGSPSSRGYPPTGRGVSERVSELSSISVDSGGSLSARRRSGTMDETAAVATASAVNAVINDPFWTNELESSNRASISGSAERSSGVQASRSISHESPNPSPVHGEALHNNRANLASMSAAAAAAMSDLDSILDGPPEVPTKARRPSTRMLGVESADAGDDLGNMRRPSLNRTKRLADLSDVLPGHLAVPQTPPQHSTKDDDIPRPSSHALPAFNASPHALPAFNSPAVLNGHSTPSSSSAITAQPLVDLNSYPAIRRKLEELSLLLRHEGYSEEDINSTIFGLTLTEMVEVKDLTYLRMLVDSRKTSGAANPLKETGIANIKDSQRSHHQTSFRRPYVEHSGPPRLLHDMKIRVRYPEKNMNSVLLLHRGIQYHDVMTTILADIGGQRIGSPILLHVDAAGWSREIRSDARHSNDIEFSLFDLSELDLIEVRDIIKGAVGGRYRLAFVANADRGNDSYQMKVRGLCRNYSGYRKIKGDGNCYYRSIVFGVLEQIIKEGNRQAFRFIYDTFKSVLFENRDHNADHNELLAAMAAASDGTGWLTVEELEADMLLEARRLDLAVIRACKKIVSMTLIKEKDSDINGLPLKDAILPSYEDCKTLAEVCREYVLKMGVCAEGAHVDLGILPRALRCESHIVILPRERTSEVKTLHTQLPNGGKKKIADIHILFRPGHYDLLYVGVDEEGVASDFNVSISSSASFDHSESMRTPSKGHGMGGGSLSSAATSNSASSSESVDQLTAMLSIPQETAERLLARCGGIEAAVDYYLANPKQFESLGRPSGQVPASPYSGSTSAAVRQTPMLPPRVPVEPRTPGMQPFAPIQQTSQQQQQQQSLSQPPHGQQQVLNHDREEHILASAVTQYPFLAASPHREIIMQARGYNYPVTDIIDSIIVLKFSSLKEVLNHCAGVTASRGRPGAFDPTVPAPRAPSPAPSGGRPSASGSGGLGKESDMADFRWEEQKHPELSDTYLYILIHQVVVGLGFPFPDVVNAVTQGRCRNVLSILRTIQCHILRIPNEFQHMNQVKDEAEDGHIVQLIGNAVSLRVEKKDAVDAVVFDFSRSLEEVMDSVNARAARQSSEYLAHHNSIIDPQLPNEAKLSQFDFKVRAMDRPEIIHHLKKLRIGFDEVAEGQISTRKLRNKLRNGVYARIDRLNLLYSTP